VKVPEGFLYNRIVPAEWQRDLDRLTPRQDRTTWLQLAWMSGDPWQPVQRWCVYEMVPLQVWLEIIGKHMARGKKPEETIEWEQWQDLEGPNPRDRGYYDTVMQCFLTDGCTVTRQEWELYREHGKAIPKLYWIIQGDHGGHLRRYGQLETQWLELAGRPTDPPAPGDLPYAPYDRRVFDQLAHRAQLKQLESKLSQDRGERSSQKQELRAAIVKWIESQSREVLESEKIDLSGIPTSSDDPTGQIERETANYIETGTLSGH
jgi:hypothetical protein